jgi:hypothetical protein
VTLTLLGLHLLSTLFMSGLIWFVQAVHYPLMRDVPAEAFVRYEQRHQRATTWVVAPAMLVELITAIALMLVLSWSAALVMAGVNLGLLMGIWASTLAVQMPIHRRLAWGHERTLIDQLIRTNWVRTVLWSLRSVLVLWLAYKVVG